MNSLTQIELLLLKLERLHAENDFIPEDWPERNIRKVVEVMKAYVMQRRSYIVFSVLIYLCSCNNSTADSKKAYRSKGINLIPFDYHVLAGSKELKKTKLKLEDSPITSKEIWARNGSVTEQIWLINSQYKVKHYNSFSELRDLYDNYKAEVIEVLNQKFVLSTLQYQGVKLGIKEAFTTVLGDQSFLLLSAANEAIGNHSNERYWLVFNISNPDKVSFSMLDDVGEIAGAACFQDYDDDKNMDFLRRPYSDTIIYVYTYKAGRFIKDHQHFLRVKLPYQRNVRISNPAFGDTIDIDKSQWSY